MAADHPSGPLRPEPRMLTAVAAGGVVGSLLRWRVALLWPVVPGAFPWSTLGVNVSGALLLGALAGLLEAAPRPLLRALVGTGLLGGFTTFSTLEAELRALAADGRAFGAAGYAVASLLLGVAAAALGLRAGRSAAGRA